MNSLIPCSMFVDGLKLIHEFYPHEFCKLILLLNINSLKDVYLSRSPPLLTLILWKLIFLFLKVLTKHNILFRGGIFSNPLKNHR